MKNDYVLRAHFFLVHPVSRYLDISSSYSEYYTEAVLLPAGTWAVCWCRRVWCRAAPAPRSAAARGSAAAARSRRRRPAGSPRRTRSRGMTLQSVVTCQRMWSVLWLKLRFLERILQDVLVPNHNFVFVSASVDILKNAVWIIWI